MEADLGRKLVWGAVNHCNSDNLTFTWSSEASTPMATLPPSMAVTFLEGLGTGPVDPDQRARATDRATDSLPASPRG
jgi:hypothetical protein